MKMRDYRKDPLAMLHTVMAQCAQIMYPNADVSEITNLSALEVLDGNLPDINELKKRKAGYVMLIKPDLTYEISYDEFQDTKMKINSSLSSMEN